MTEQKLELSLAINVTPMVFGSSGYNYSELGAEINLIMNALRERGCVQLVTDNVGDQQAQSRQDLRFLKIVEAFAFGHEAFLPIPDKTKDVDEMHILTIIRTLTAPIIGGPTPSTP